jgi:hypothetical protein
MVIADRNLPIGSTLIGSYRGAAHRCAVIDRGDGRPGFRLDDGQVLRTPSGAGRAVMGGVACNGWRFWNVETGAPDGATTVDNATAQQPPGQGLPWWPPSCRQGHAAGAQGDCVATDTPARRGGQWWLAPTPPPEAHFIAPRTASRTRSTGSSGRVGAARRDAPSA